MGALRDKLGEERGVVFILVIIALVVLLAFAALALDVGNVMVVRNELQNISDGASLAATRYLGNIYEGMSYTDQQTYDASGDAAAIISVAQQVAESNTASGASMSVNASDVEIGRWDPQNRVFTQNLMQPDAVRVKSRKDGSANGPVATFFARIFGMDTVDVNAGGTAALTGQSTAGPGGLPVPAAISRYWFENLGAVNFCNQPIRFYPANDPSSCAGWHVYTQSPANDQRLRTTITNLENGSYESPETIAGETQFTFIGGTMSTLTFNAMRSLFEANINYDSDGDGIDDAWQTSVPVYDADDCANPHGRIMIVGFATIVITAVLGSPIHQIDGYVLCNNVEPGRGSGGNYGTKGSIPGLVQ